MTDGPRVWQHTSSPGPNSEIQNETGLIYMTQGFLKNSNIYLVKWRFDDNNQKKKVHFLLFWQQTWLIDHYSFLNKKNISVRSLSECFSCLTHRLRRWELWSRHNGGPEIQRKEKRGTAQVKCFSVLVYLRCWGMLAERKSGYYECKHVTFMRMSHLGLVNAVSP